MHAFKALALNPLNKYKKIYYNENASLTIIDSVQSHVSSAECLVQFHYL